MPPSRSAARVLHHAERRHMPGAPVRRRREWPGRNFPRNRKIRCRLAFALTMTRAIPSMQRGSTQGRACLREIAGMHVFRSLAVEPLAYPADGPAEQTWLADAGAFIVRPPSLLLSSAPRRHRLGGPRLGPDHFALSNPVMGAAG